MTYHNHEDAIEFGSSPGHQYALLIDERHGAVNGVRVGVSLYDETDYASPGVHEFQETFYVVTGRGRAKIGEQEFAIRPGSAFVAPAGTPHAIRREPTSEPVKIIWSHAPCS